MTFVIPLPADIGSFRGGTDLSTEVAIFSEPTRPASSTRAAHALRVLIISPSASYRYGGESVLPFHYFRGLCARGIPTWLITNARSRNESLARLSSDEFSRVRFLPDTFWHGILSTIAEHLPTSLATFAIRQSLEIIDQRRALDLAAQMIRSHRITIVHQPTPVSPKHVSALKGLPVPLVIGPMNGGISFPKGLAGRENFCDRLFVAAGRTVAGLANRLIPGKLHAQTLLVANQRSRDALPSRVIGNIQFLVENGVDLAVYDHVARPSPSQSNAAVVHFAYAGRLIHLKGVDLLLRAAARARESANIHLDIIGDGPCKRQLQKLAATLSLEDHITFHGWLPHHDCAKILARAHVFVLPSLRECGGAAILEAMAMRLPVIASNWGGPADYVDPSCGILIDVQSSEQFVNDLATAIIKLAGNAELRTALGQAGYLKVLKQYDWRAKIDRIIEIYEATIAARVAETSRVTS